MALITRRLVLEKAANAINKARTFSSTDSETILAKSILTESSRKFSSLITYDIFLSHSYLDKKEVIGLKELFEELGHSVYIDWISDQQLERENVNKQTANTLRERMKCCRCLFFSISSNSANSKWMPWELGFMDSEKGRVAICPISDSSSSDDYEGQEYLGLYPYVTTGQINGTTKYSLWIHESSNKYVIFDKWLEGNEPKSH